jgi:DNA mismatch repair ATPase MutL
MNLNVVLAHREFSFRLVHNDQEVYHLLTAPLRKRIVDVFGKSYNDKLVPVSENTDIVRIEGFVGKPEAAKKSRGEQFFFVNNRFFKDTYFNHAVTAAFEQLLPAKMFPSYFLFLEVDPKQIDVNVHPTKTEIKFEEDKAIYSILRSAIRLGLGKFNISPTLDFDRESEFDLPMSMQHALPVEPEIKVDKSYNPFNVSNQSSVYSSNTSFNTSNSSSKGNGFSKALNQAGFGSEETNGSWDQFWNPEDVKMQDESLNIGFSKRTLQRDLKEIRNVFGIDIEYSKSQKGYFISQKENENMNFQRMMEAFDMFNSLNLAQDLTPFIHLEKRRPQGTENLYGLLHAIKNRIQIKFTYHKFWEEEFSLRIVEPYALKEFKNRWYVLAKDCNDNNIKSFALDRLTNLEITNQLFLYPDNYNVELSYRYCFGIISPNGSEPREIILSFDPFQGKYIKTLPLHDTQEILVDNDQETIIKLKLCLTHDLLMELLSFGDNMKVIEPLELAEKIQQEHEKAFKIYIS